MTKTYNLEKLTSRAVFEAVQPLFSEVEVGFGYWGNPNIGESDKSLYLCVRHLGTDKNIRAGKATPYLNFKERPGKMVFNFDQDALLDWQQQFDAQAWQLCQRLLAGISFQIVIQPLSDNLSNFRRADVYNQSHFKLSVNGEAAGLCVPSVLIKADGWQTYLPNTKDPGSQAVAASILIQKTEELDDDRWRKTQPNATQYTEEDSRRMGEDFQGRLARIETNFPRVFAHIAALLE